MRNLKIKRTSEYSKKKKQTHKYREQTSGYGWEEQREEGQYRGR